MKTVKIERKVKYEVTFDESRKGARAHAMDEVRHMMASRNDPLPFEVRGAHAEFGIYRIERVWQ